MSSQTAVTPIAVFDINGTLYNKKSSEEFFRFICYRHSYKLLDIYHIFIFKLLKKLHAVNQTQFKENFFNYLDGLPPEELRRYASEFWRIEYPAYFNQPLLQRIEILRAEGVKIFCISGGLDVYMDALYDYFPVDAQMSTQVTYTGKTYKIKGEACKGQEKIRRLEEHMQGQTFEVVEAYSDQPEDILDLARKAFIVNKDGSLKPHHPSKTDT